MSPADSTNRRLLHLAPWLVCALLVALKFWLVGAQRLTAAGDAGLDDRLFIDLAASIARGDWLGDYNVRTLAKGPGYPLFIAICHWLHLPLPFAQQLLYTGACAALAAALAPLFLHRLGAFALFAVLLFNPMSSEAQIMGRVLRQHLSTPAALALFAGLIGLWLHAHASYRARLGWSVLAGAGLALSWITREEAGLLLPAAGLLWFTGMLGHRKSWQRRPTWWLLATPILIWIGVSSTVALLNLRAYGAAVTVEFRASAFADAYGALVRVKPRDFQPYVPVTRETRERIYAISPAFAELRGYLEGEAGLSWAAHSSSVTGRPGEEGEIAGGWFMWALRDAVAAAGHASDAKSALAFYRRVADEVNAACDDGRLDSRPRRSGFAPVWQSAYQGRWADAFAHGWKMVVGFRDYFARGGPSSGDAESLELFQSLTRAHLSPPEGEPRDHNAIERARLRTLERIGVGYQLVHPWLFAVAAVTTLALGLVSGRRQWRFLLVQLSLLATTALTLAALALIHVASFPALLTGYFQGLYPLILTFTFVGLAPLGDLWPLRRHTGDAES